MGTEEGPSLAEFVDTDVRVRRLPPCCQVPRDLMAQIEENAALPPNDPRKRTYASCARWLAEKGYPLPRRNLQGHIDLDHAERFA